MTHLLDSWVRVILCSLVHNGALYTAGECCNGKFIQPSDLTDINTCPCSSWYQKSVLLQEHLQPMTEAEALAVGQLEVLQITLSSILQ